MKAIQIKYLGPTLHKSARLRAWTDAGQIIESRDFEYNVEQQALMLAQRYANEKEWPVITGFGALADGSFVATMKGSI